MKTIEEVGADYIEELTQRFFFNGPDGSILHAWSMLARLLSGKEYFMSDEYNPLDNLDEVYHLYVNNHPAHLEIYPRQGLRALELHTKGDMLALFTCIGSLKHLRYLWITRYMYKNLPDSLPTLYYLQTLVLHECFNVAKLPEGFENLVNLKFLSFWVLSLESLPILICLLSNLQELVLHEREIEVLGESLGKLVNLRILRLTMLRFLRKLPENIGELAKLIALDIRGTKLIWSPNLKMLPKDCKIDVDLKIWCDWLLEGFCGSSSSP